MTSSQIIIWLGRGTGEDYREFEATVDFEIDGYGTRVAHYGEPLDGSAPIKLTPAEIERATDKAWQAFGEEVFAS